MCTPEPEPEPPLYSFLGSLREHLRPLSLRFKHETTRQFSTWRYLALSSLSSSLPASASSVSSLAKLHMGLQERATGGGGVGEEEKREREEVLKRFYHQSGVVPVFRDRESLMSTTTVVAGTPLVVAYVLPG